MRAPKQQAVGSSGQSVVKAQFERLSWGVAPNPEHDLGTDHWLMARDPRRWDMQALVGAQVKSGESWFDEPEIVDGELLGWWFREADDSHFNYWVGHSVPHIIVLNRPSDDMSFWVHVTPDAVIATGKGRKILVPATSTVDADHLEALMAVAASRSSVTEWQGSAWSPGQTVPESSRLRYALLTPRLVAPHPNKGTGGLTAAEAIALLVQFRLNDIQRWTDSTPTLDVTAAEASTEWGWLSYAALNRWLIDGDPGHLRSRLDAADCPEARAAATVMTASALIEEEDIPAALDVVDACLALDDANPVDHAWLQMQRARCLVELGQLDTARELALDVTRVGLVASSDPTARLIAGSAAELVFSLGNWDSNELVAAIQGRDNLASWWRSQTLVTGLSKQLEEDFNQWAKDRSRTWAAEDTAWLRLRSAMLLSNFAADTPSWRYAGSLLARRQLMTADTDEAHVMALDLLRICGAEKVTGLATQRLLNDGPVDPLVHVVSSLDLTKSQRTSVHANLTMLQHAADVLPPQAADRHARWTLEAINNLDGFKDRYHPTFLALDRLLALLRSLAVAVTDTVADQIRQHVLDLPPITDQLSADRYARLIDVFDPDEWKLNHVDRLTTRPPGDHSALTAAIERLQAAKNPAFRDSLVDRIAQGDLDALRSFGNVTELPTAAVAGMIAVAAENVRSLIAQARSGVHGFGGPDSLRTLVMLNVWHPHQADWATVMDCLTEPAVPSAHIADAVSLIGRLAHVVAPPVAQQLRAPLDLIAARPSSTEALDPFFPDADSRGPAATALALLFPDDFDDSSFRALLRGDQHQRAAAARIAAARRGPADLPVLAVLSKDPDNDVRSAVAAGLTRWLVVSSDVSVLELLADVLTDPGVRAGRTIAGALDEDTIHVGVEQILDQLSRHPSAVVRYRSANARRSVL